MDRKILLIFISIALGLVAFTKFYNISNSSIKDNQLKRTDGPVNWDFCPEYPIIVNVEQLDFNPSTLKAGKSVTLTIRISGKKEVVLASADIHLKYLFAKFSKTLTFQPYKLTSESYEAQVSIDIPSVIPPGKYSFRAEVKDLHKQVRTCAYGNVRIHRAY